jgi:hypothetical protein
MHVYAPAMGFFDDLEPPRLPEEPEHETPVWLSAPEGWIGGLVPFQELIARSEEAAVAVARIVAYPFGFELTLDVFTRSRSRDWMFDHRPWSSGERPPEELLRYGIEFADGRRASDLGEMLGGTTFAMSASADEEPDPATQMRLIPGGGHGGERHSRQELWVWPLPPPGPVAFVCQWPKHGIPESRVEVDAAVIRAAAEQAIELWPE